MQIKETDIIKLVERLGEHYRSNINNRILRPALLKLDINNTTWEKIDRLTEASSVDRIQGYNFEELYEEILAIATLINHAKNQLAPNIRTKLSGGVGTGRGAESATDRVLREMAVNNFVSNLGVLSDMVNDLYTRTVELDKRENAGKTTVLSKMPELKQVGRLLV